ncbi:hypothetical protein, partial [Pseudomonas lundensis]|uniref:hypothetical protein n=1 Tax=Pseudomonas lundensis TaxID=86185 RepID=UPI001E3787BD
MDYPLHSDPMHVDLSISNLMAGLCDKKAYPARPRMFTLPRTMSSKPGANHRAVAGAECNTVIELKPEHHAALPWNFA